MAINLSVDVLTKLEASGLEIKAVCARADVSPSTVTLMKRKGSCSQRIYDQMLMAIQDMCRERQEKMKAAGLIV